MQPFNIFQTGGRQKFLKKKKQKKVKVQTQSKQQSQILMIQKNVRRFIQLKRYFDHINCQIQLQVENNQGNLLQQQSDKRSQLFYCWLLTPYKIRQDNLQCKLIQFWHKNVQYFDQNQLFINNNNSNLLQQQCQQYNNNSLLLRMMKLTVNFLGDIFIIDQQQGIKITRKIIKMYKLFNINTNNKEQHYKIEQSQARTLLQTLDNINTQQTKRLRVEFIDSLLLSTNKNNPKTSKNSNELCMKLLSQEKLIMEYLLAKDKLMDESFIKDVVVGCYVNVLLTKVKDKSYVSKIAQTTQDYRDNNNNDINFQTLCSVYNKILKFISSSSSHLSSYSLQPTIQNNNQLKHQQQKTILMCLLRDLALRMKHTTIQQIIHKYKINPKIFDSDTQYLQYLQQKDQYLILREQMMGEYERSKRLIKQSLQLLLMVSTNTTNKRQQQPLLFTSSIGINNNYQHISLLQPLMQQTAFQYIYQLLTVLGDAQILPLDKAIKLFVESVNQVMIYNLGKQFILNNNSNLSISTTTSLSSTVENKFLLLLTLIQKSTQQTPDLHFIKLYQSQQNKQTLKKLIKQYLLKILKHLMFLPYPTISTSKIVTITTAILQNLYNKIFRTNILSTEIFQNTSFIMKFKNYSFKTNTKDQISQFLIQFPYVFPLAMRADKFKEIIRLQRQRYQYHGFHVNNDDSDDDYYGRNVKIRRNHQFQDAFEQLRKKDLKKPFRITFINQLGFEEKGVDAGGLKKQFLNRVLKDALNPKNGMFIENSNHELLPHPTKAQLNEGLFAEYYEFIGKLIGLAIYSNITLGYKFSGTFLNAIVGKKNCFDDLRTIDPSLYKSLIYIKDMEEDARQLQLTFLYQDEARNRLIQLLPNGHSIPVTNENKRLYISLLTGYKVNRSLQHQTRFIRKGLTQMINKECLFMFNYEELNYLISGQGKIDVDDLKYHTKVVGFDEKSTTIKNFWQVVKQFDEDQKSKLLMFVTACPRPSFLGFRQLSPPFTIACMKDKQHLLPISHTCSNVLELPDYKDRQELKKKLLTAIESNAGFEFG